MCLETLSYSEIQTRRGSPTRWQRHEFPLRPSRLPCSFLLCSQDLQYMRNVMIRFRKPGKSKPSLEYIGFEPHVSLRHGAPTSLLQDICSRYSLNKCDAWVTVAFARIAAATMAASVSIVSFAPARRASFICISMQ